MRLILSIALMLLCVPTFSGISRLPLFGPAVSFSASPVPLDSKHPARRRLGALIFERGYRLTSSDPGFGGFSSLVVDRGHFLLLNDGGNFMRFSLDSSGILSARSSGFLLGGPSRGWEKRDRDSESMSYDPVSRRLWVGFENFNEIWRYSPGLARAETHSAPPLMRRWPRNLGAESMVRLGNGQFVVIAEANPWPHGIGRAAILFAGDPTVMPRRSLQFSYLPPKGYDPSDAAALPGGSLIVLNRRFAFDTGFTAILTVIDLQKVKPGARIAGRPIAAFKGSVTRDNFEGVAVTQEADGTKLWLVTDDNQSLFQQTLLMKFKLDDAGVPRR